MGSLGMLNIAAPPPPPKKKKIILGLFKINKKSCMMYIKSRFLVAGFYCTESYMPFTAEGCNLQVAGQNLKYARTVNDKLLIKWFSKGTRTA